MVTSMGTIGISYRCKLCLDIDDGRGSVSFGKQLAAFLKGATLSLNQWLDYTGFDAAFSMSQNPKQCAILEYRVEPCCNTGY